jgi:hypothetical protein
VRETAEQLTVIDDWCEAIFAANVVFEPLVGELFRSHLVQQAAAGNGDYLTPTVVGVAEYDFAGAGSALQQGDVRTAHQRRQVRRPQQVDHAGLAVHLGAARDRRGPDVAVVVITA